MRINVRIANSLGRKLIYIGRYSITITIAAQVGAEVFGANPQQIRLARQTHGRLDFRYFLTRKDSFR
jgi:hypothetical protein